MKSIRNTQIIIDKKIQINIDCLGVICDRLCKRSLGYAGNNTW